METQLTPQVAVPEERDPIESFPSVPREVEEVHDVGLDCNCGIAVSTPPRHSQYTLTDSMQVPDDCLFCESGCGRWYHIWCVKLWPS